MRSLRLVPTGNLKKGDFLRANEAGEIKEIDYVANARRSGYKVAVFTDGSQSAVGHKTGFTTIYLEEATHESAALK